MTTDCPEGRPRVEAHIQQRSEESTKKKTKKEKQEKQETKKAPRRLSSWTQAFPVDIARLPNIRTTYVRRRNVILL